MKKPQRQRTHKKISDGNNLHILYLDTNKELAGASLYIKNADSSYTVYDYGIARQYEQERPLSTIDQRHVLNNTDAGTAPINAWVEPLGTKSILEIVSGASVFRRYVQANSDTSVIFNVSPVISETTMNGTPVYKLDFSTPEGSGVIAWLSTIDGHILQERFETESSTLPNICGQANSNSVVKSRQYIQKLP